MGLRRQADSANPASLSYRLRARRLARFEELIRPLPRPIRLVDIGGTAEFWEGLTKTRPDDLHLTIVNLEPQRVTRPNTRSLVADATDLSVLEDRSFDVAFSNSVIEHLRTFDMQGKMAAEVRRLAPAYWVQTPNYWFPIEPHFLFPAWHWLPLSWRIALIRRRAFGWRGPYPDEKAAAAMVSEIRLLSRSELRSLFPDAVLVPERVFGWVKSWVAVGGFPDGAGRLGRSASR